jgi:2'-hydroxyisoflavone reductase
MNKTRRRILQASLAGSAALMSGCVRSDSEPDEPRSVSRGDQPLRILILGGTGFIGPHMVHEALRRGHEISLFNRGRTNRALFPDLELLVGDRNNGHDALIGRRWDAVVDNSGYVPRHVADSAQLLSSAVSHYIYVSSVSVYAAMSGNLTAANYHDVDVANTEYESPLVSIADETVEEVTSETYGPLKVLCERAATEAMGEDRITILRPTWVAGPGDNSDRFTHWPVRVSRGGEMLVPGMPSDQIQIVDVRDLANFVVDSIEQNITGIYNMVNPPGTYSMGQLMTDCQMITGSDASLTWVDLPFIEKHGLDAAGELPIWAPMSGDTRSDALINGDRSFAKGMKTRPERETIRDILQWWPTLPEDRRNNMRAGMSAEREAEMLAAWHAQNV